MTEVIKNPNRDRPRPIEIRKPEYERLGVNPTPFIPGNYGGMTSLLPIAVPVAPQLSLAPETVSEVDGSSFGQEGKRIMKPSKKGHIIDNNEFLNFGFSSQQEMSDAVENGDFIDLDSDLESKPEIPEVGEYILMISGNMIMCGSLNVIEEKVKAILYGEDIDFELSEIPQEEIIILKRVDIQIGVFIKD